MGLKCSILGHRFEETEVERDREEQGSEVVTTIRELETCTRCGERQVVSENKEVTTLATPEEPTGSSSDDAPADDDGEATAESTGEEPTEASSDEPVDSAEIVEETTTATIPDAETATEEPDESVTPAETSAPTEQPESDTTDDAVILDDEDDAVPERDPGEWPEEPEERLQSPEDAADWPESGREPAAEADFETPLLQEDDSARPASEADVTVPEGTYRCDECGFTTDVEASSLRRGDFCPECHRGTLIHEVDEA
jgi:DNA-directed RNA polymerase subunit RPC12/RpoP